MTTPKESIEEIVRAEIREYIDECLAHSLKEKIEQLDMHAAKKEAEMHEKSVRLYHELCKLIAMRLEKL